MQVSIIRLVEHRVNTGWYQIILNVNNIRAETSFMPRSDIMSRFNLSAGQILDYCNK